MGWPLGEHYAASSNVDNAYKLQGKVLLVVGEMDTNVDPASTYQVVNQLIKHNKEFELLMIPGAGHTNGGAYGEHKRFDFFARHLLGVKPPEWKAIEDATKKNRRPLRQRRASSGCRPRGQRAGPCGVPHKRLRRVSVSPVGSVASAAR